MTASPYALNAPASTGTNGKAHALDAFGGAKVDVVDKDGDTALHCAAESGRSYVLEALINVKSKLKAKNKLGQTPLLEVLYGLTYFRDLDGCKDKEIGETRWYRCARLLVHAGADVGAKDDEGKTAMDVS